jgi:hypothetical protein
MMTAKAKKMQKLPRQSPRTSTVLWASRQGLVLMYRPVAKDFDRPVAMGLANVQATRKEATEAMSPQMRCQRAAT